MKWLRTHPWILLLAIIKFLLPFLAPDNAWELHRDEYLYMAQGLHPDWGYLENPSMIGWLGYLSHLAGGSLFWVKFWPALIGAFTLIFTAALAEEFGGGLFAQVLASLGILLTAYLRIHYLFQPNMLDILAWLLIAYFLVRFINTKKSSYLYLLALSIAFGIWSKYSVVFFLVALFLSLLLTRHRNIFTNRHCWITAALALILITPNILWQWSHNWPVIHHMKELQDTQLQYISSETFLKEQALMLLPVLFVWTSGLAWLFSRSEYRVLAFTWLFTILLLLAGSGKGYYALGAYPMLLSAGGKVLELLTTRKQWLRYVSIAIILVIAIPFINMLLPMAGPANMAALNIQMSAKDLGLLKWEDLEDHALQQDYADMLGWRELAQKTENVYDNLPPHIKDATIVYCRNYGQAGSLMYYAKSAAFRDRVISDNGTFTLWVNLPLNFRHLLFVGEEAPGEGDGVFEHFEKYRIEGEVKDTLSRSYRSVMIFFENADQTAVSLANKSLMAKQSRFKNQ